MTPVHARILCNDDDDDDDYKCDTSNNTGKLETSQIHSQST